MYKQGGKMQELALATDSQLRNIARTKANYEYISSPKRKTETNFALMLPVMDSFLLGAGTKGSLGQKIATGGNQLKDWGIFLAVTHLYSKAVNKLVEKSQTLQNFKENSPTAFGVANIVTGLAAGISGIHYVNKGFQKFVSPLIPKGVKNAAKGIFEATDSSSLGKTINNGMKTFTKKYPKLSKTVNKAVKWAMPVLCLGFLASMAIDAVKAKASENETFNELSDARLAAAQQLAVQKQGES